MSLRLLAGAVAGLLAAFHAPAQAAEGGAIPGLAQAVTTASGLKEIDRQVGSGDAAQTGMRVTVNYSGWLYQNGEKGIKFDSSYDRHEPFSFILGQGAVIAGWDEGVAGMKPGGRRTLIVPPELGYGERGAGGVIPPNATLVFDVELISLKPAAGPR